MEAENPSDKSGFFCDLSLIKQLVQLRRVLVVNFCIFEIELFCLVDALFDLVQNVKAIFHLP